MALLEAEAGTGTDVLGERVLTPQHGSRGCAEDRGPERRQKAVSAEWHIVKQILACVSDSIDCHW
jgi:hypothetical protein